MGIIQANQLDPTKLHAIISQDLKKYKPDALELAFNEMQAEGFARYFAVNAMLQDPDYHDQNAGITTLKDGKSYLTRIDHGKAFVFVGSSGNEVDKLKNKITADLDHDNKYTEFYEARLYSPNFAAELEEAANDINKN